MLDALVVVLLVIGIGAGAGVHSGLLDECQGSPYRYPDSVATISTECPLEFLQHAQVISRGPKFNPLQNPLSPPNPRSAFNHGSTNSPKFSGRCTDGVRTNLLFRVADHFTNVTDSVTSRNSARTLQHTLHGSGLPCPACEAAKERAMQVNLSPSLLFRDAAEQWRESRRSQLSAGSYENYRQYIKSLNTFFGDLTLEQIHIGHLEEYQELRSESAGPSRLNHELSTVQQILKRAKLWGNIRDYYEALPLPEPQVGMALEPEEEEYLFKVASKKSRWKTAYCCGLLSNTTTLGPKEILRIKLGDIYLERTPPVIHISRGVKNRFRVRTVPLYGDGLKAMEMLLEMAAKKGSTHPDHYLCPARPKTLPAGYNRSKSHYDPNKPMGSYRKAWEALRKEAGKKYPRLLTVRRYDLRHNACTKLLEDPRVSERTIEEMMGHKINSRTKERYSHIRMQRKLAAVEILNSGHTAQEKKKPQKAENIASSTLSYFFKF